MTLIKKIIAWIISLFRRLFSVEKSSNNHSLMGKNTSKMTNKKRMVNGVFNGEMPPYLMISEQEKQILINDIRKLKSTLMNDYAKAKIIQKIMELADNNLNEEELLKLKEELDNQDFSKLSLRKVNDLLNDLKMESEQIKVVEETINEQNNFVKKATINLDHLLEYIEENNISIGGKDIINNEVLSIPKDEETTVLLDKDILNVIKDWDKSIIDKVKLDYEKVNYVTISTVLVDKIIDKYQTIEEDYHHHRYNRRYYEKELNKIKQQLDYLEKLKNKPAVYQEIERLRKELYSKSKDKYDLLYNNEMFMNINKKCDELLAHINQRVIDINKQEEKKAEKKEEKKEKKEEKQKEDYLQKILLRFEDLDLAKKLIQHYHENRENIVDNLGYINSSYNEFLNGIDGEFNFQRNKAKTELVKLYNDLNKMIANIKKESYVSLEHINFRMEDLIDAVVVRKGELSNIYPLEKGLPSSQLVDDKIAKMQKKYLEIANQKVLKKTYNS